MPYPQTGNQRPPQIFLQHSPGKVPQLSRRNRPKRPQIVPNLVEIIDIPDILFARKLVPLVEMRRRMASVLGAVALHDLGEGAAPAALKGQEFLVGLVDELLDWMAISGKLPWDLAAVWYPGWTL